MFLSLSTAIITLFFKYSNKNYCMKQKKKKKHNKVLSLGKTKLDCIEMLISQSIIDLNISHDELKMIINQKKIMMIKSKP